MVFTARFRCSGQLFRSERCVPAVLVTEGIFLCCPILFELFRLFWLFLSVLHLEHISEMVKEKLVEIAALKRELGEYKSIRGRLSTANVETQNRELRRENQALREENRRSWGLRS